MRRFIALLGLMLLVAAAGPAPAAPANDGWRQVDPENLLVLTTTKGVVLIEMEPRAAPQSVAHLKALVRAGFYDGSLWYRVASFVAQTGDRGTWKYSSGAPGLPAEFTFTDPAGGIPPPPVEIGPPAPRFVGSLPIATPPAGSPTNPAWANFCIGVAGLAHGDDPNSGESQMFFALVKADNLDRLYTAWGRVLMGMDVLKALAPGEPPAQPDKILTARIAADIPAAERPMVEVLDTTGPRFERLLKDARRSRGGENPRACDVDLQARLRPAS